MLRPLFTDGAVTVDGSDDSDVDTSDKEDEAGRITAVERCRCTPTEYLIGCDETDSAMPARAARPRSWSGCDQHLLISLVRTRVDFRTKTRLVYKCRECRLRCDPQKSKILGFLLLVFTFNPLGEFQSLQYNFCK
jgi:hypothetical protein